MRGDPRHSCLRCRPPGLRATLRPSSRASRPLASWCRTGCSARRCGRGSGSMTAISVRLPCSVAAVCTEATGVTLELEGPGAGGSVRLRARLAVAADGARFSGASRGRHHGDAKRTTARLASWPMSPPTWRTMAPRTNALRTAGPLALLPLRDGSYTVVWARTPARCRRHPRGQRCGFPGPAAAALRLARRQVRARRPSRQLSSEAGARG